jgi:peroxiredoxin Q/BCP
MLKWLLTFLVVASGLLLWRMAAAAKRNLPAVGDEAPAFELPDQDGKSRNLGEFRGKWLVLYFYPRDDTPGCTTQACRFRDDSGSLETLGAVVCGVSVDDSESHADFARTHKLPFTLLADRGGKTAARFGSLWTFGPVKIAKRNTFLIDPRGRVARVYLSADPARNSAEVIADLRQLKGR